MILKCCIQSVLLFSAKFCLILCNHMDCSMPGLPVHHQVTELAQTHAHRVNDTIQPSHLCCPLLLLPQSFPASESFSMSQFFTSGGQSIGVSASASVQKVVDEPWKTLGFLASRQEEFNPGPVTKLDRCELLCNKVLLEYKREKASNIDIRKGHKQCPLLVFGQMLYRY